MTAIVSFSLACLAIWLSTYNAITGDLVTAAFGYTLAALLVAIEIVAAALTDPLVLKAQAVAEKAMEALQ